MEYTLILPTAIHKYPWLIRTLFGYRNQTKPPKKILVGLDTKPEDADKTINLKDFGTVELVVFDPPSDLKRQHEIINKLVSKTDESDIVLIADDDYWIEDRTLVERMLASFTSPQSFVYLDGYYQYYTEMPKTNPTLRGNEITYHVPGVRYWFSTREEDGHHNPCCGHPKIIGSKKFQEIGGFDTFNFTHYWWSDTDLYLRTKELCTIKPISGSAIHLNHPRYKYKAFADKNRKTLEMLYPGYIPASERKK